MDQKLMFGLLVFLFTSYCIEEHLYKSVDLSKNWGRKSFRFHLYDQIFLRIWRSWCYLVWLLTRKKGLVWDRWVFLGIFYAQNVNLSLRNYTRRIWVWLIVLHPIVFHLSRLLLLKYHLKLLWLSSIIIVLLVKLI